jgi:archaemetzincin
MRHRSRYLHVAVMVFTTALLGASAAAAEPMPPKALRAAADRLRPLYSPSPKTDWIERHPEERGQTFEQYIASRPNRPSAKRNTLYIQPLGEFTAIQDKAVAATASYLGLFYGLPVQRLPNLPLDDVPAYARRVHPRWGDKQILCAYVLDRVVKRRPENAVAVLALTTIDLWPGEDWNFVFGQASLEDRVGVWSLYRYGDPQEEYPLYLRRTLKVAVHETGHMLGMLHCTAYRCGMNGANNRPEMDATPLAFCPECAAKTWWACNLQPSAWHRGLIKFSVQENLSDEADFWRKALETLGPQANRPK